MCSGSIAFQCTHQQSEGSAECRPEQRASRKDLCGTIRGTVEFLLSFHDELLDDYTYFDVYFVQFLLRNIAALFLISHTNQIAPRTRQQR